MFKIRRILFYLLIYVFAIEFQKDLVVGFSFLKNVFL